MDLEVRQMRAGWFADLLLVDGDPTADVTIMQDKAPIPVVMKGGAFYRNLSAVA